MVKVSDPWCNIRTFRAARGRIIPGARGGASDVAPEGSVWEGRADSYVGGICFAGIVVVVVD
jgi:hypothetical protein